MQTDHELVHSFEYITINVVPAFYYSQKHHFFEIERTLLSLIVWREHGHYSSRFLTVTSIGFLVTSSHLWACGLRYLTFLLFIVFLGVIGDHIEDDVFLLKFWIISTCLVCPCSLQNFPRWVNVHWIPELTWIPKVKIVDIMEIRTRHRASSKTLIRFSVCHLFVSKCQFLCPCLKQNHYGKNRWTVETFYKHE